jgi:hypothetical protein
MRRALVGCTGLLLLDTMLPFYFAATGAFARPETTTSFEVHQINGVAILPTISVLTTLAAALAKAPDRLVALAAAPIPLVGLETLVVTIGDSMSGGSDAHTTAAGLAVMGLHAIGGLAILAAIGSAFVRALRFTRV